MTYPAVFAETTPDKPALILAGSGEAMCTSAEATALICSSVLSSIRCFSRMILC